MKVTIHAPLSLGNKSYAQGVQDVPDHLYANMAFAKHVKAGTIVVHPKDLNAQKVQASKDQRALQKAQELKGDVQDAITKRAQLVGNKQIAGGPVPMSQAEKMAAGPAKFAEAPLEEVAKRDEEEKAVDEDEQA